MSQEPEHFVRPEIVVLGDDSLIPAQNRIVPAPNQFTHEVTRAVPFYYAHASPDAQPAGQFDPGTRVVLLVHDGGSRCWVADGRGLHVETEYASLKRL